MEKVSEVYNPRKFLNKETMEKTTSKQAYVL